MVCGANHEATPPMIMSAVIQEPMGRLAAGITAVDHAGICHRHAAVSASTATLASPRAGTARSPMT